MHARHVPIRRELVRLGSSADSGRRVVPDMLDRSAPPTAIFAAQNQITVGVLRELRDRGVRDVISVVGFDDFAVADLLQPAITVVAQDPSRVGRVAARMLFDRLDGDGSPYRRVIVPTTLVRRGSGEIAPRG